MNAAFTAVKEIEPRIARIVLGSSGSELAPAPAPAAQSCSKQAPRTEINVDAQRDWAARTIQRYARGLRDRRVYWAMLAAKFEEVCLQPANEWIFNTQRAKLLPGRSCAGRDSAPAACSKRAAPTKVCLMVICETSSSPGSPPPLAERA